MKIKSLLFKITVALICVPVSSFVLYRYVVIWYEYFKNTESPTTLGTVFVTLSLLILLLSVLLGFYLLVKYNKTGRILFLVLGLALTLIVPILFLFWSVPLFELLFPEPEPRVTCYVVAMSTKGLIDESSKKYKDYKDRVLSDYQQRLPGRVVAKIADKKQP